MYSSSRSTYDKLQHCRSQYVCKSTITDPSTGYAGYAGVDWSPADPRVSTRLELQLTPPPDSLFDATLEHNLILSASLCGTL